MLLYQLAVWCPYDCDSGLIIEIARSQGEACSAGSAVQETGSVGHGSVPTIHRVPITSAAMGRNYVRLVGKVVPPSRLVEQTD